jgi:hypothetical protein
VRVLHYKGGLYELIGIAHKESDPSDKEVIYRDSSGVIWSRPLEEFFSLVDTDDGKLHPRYKLIADYQGPG